MIKGVIQAIPLSSAMPATAPKWAKDGSGLTSKVSEKGPVPRELKAATWM